MEENNKGAGITEENTEAEQPMTRRVYTRQQNMLYTIISIAIFCVLYFGGKAVMGAVDRPYAVFVYGEDMSAERFDAVCELGGVLPGYCTFENARLIKSEGGYEFSVLFSADEDFVPEGIAFEYGDAEEDVRTDIYPYSENPWFAEHVYAQRVADTDGSSRELYIFERDGAFYAKFVRYGSFVPSEVSAVFAGREKIFLED